jgi:hypothetical protein
MAGYGGPSETELALPQPANSLLGRYSRSSRVGLLSAAAHAQEHRAAPDDFQHLAIGSKSDFANRLGASAMNDFYVTKSIGAGRIRGEKPECLRECAVGQNSLAGVLSDNLGAKNDRAVLSVRGLVAADLDQIPTASGNFIPSCLRNLSRVHFHN